MIFTEEQIKQKARHYAQFFTRTQAEPSEKKTLHLNDDAPPELKNMILEAPEAVYETLMHISIWGSENLQSPRC